MELFTVLITILAVVLAIFNVAQYFYSLTISERADRFSNLVEKIAKEKREEIYRLEGVISALERRLEEAGVTS